MKIRMRALAAGPNGVLLPEHTYTTPTDLTEKEAKDFIASGYADRVKEPVKPVESEPIETAVLPGPRDQTDAEAKKAAKLAAAEAKKAAKLAAAEAKKAAKQADNSAEPTSESDESDGPDVPPEE